MLLRILCDDCGFDNLPGDRYCGGCGNGLRVVGAASDPADLPGDNASDLPDGFQSPEPNRLAALRAELPLAPTESVEPLSDLDIVELDDRFIEGEP